MRRTLSLISGLLFSLVALFSGCVSIGPATPNEIYRGEYPPYFESIRRQNLLLAEEIGKLPELQNGMQETDETALRILCDVYQENTQRFDDVFNQMYGIGLPKVRKYCTPLQALFWIAQKGDPTKIIGLLKDYSLGDLLSEAWDFGPPILSDSEIEEIIEDISDANLKEQYLKDRKTSTNKQIQRFFLIDYRSNKNVFSKHAKALIKSKKSYKNPRWSDFNTVLFRLNSPELVDYYEQNQIRWVDWRTLHTWPVSARYVFEHGKGDCTAIADFTALCLSRAGYKAYEHKVAPRRTVDAHHSICIFFVDNVKYYMDNGSLLQRGIHPYSAR